MDVTKLQNVISDLDNEEEFSINVTLARLAANAGSNQLPGIPFTQGKIKAGFENSIVNNYLPGSVDLISNTYNIQTL